MDGQSSVTSCRVGMMSISQGTERKRAWCACTVQCLTAACLKFYIWPVVSESFSWIGCTSKKTQHFILLMLGDLSHSDFDSVDDSKHPLVHGKTWRHVPCSSIRSIGRPQLHKL